MVERVNFGTMGFNNQMVGDFEEIQQMPAYTPPPPRYNEGIETLVNTYSPPSDLQQQAAAQRLRASQVSSPAQNIANQQAAAFQNLLVNSGVIADPNPPVEPPPGDQPPIVDEPPIVDYNPDYMGFEDERMIGAQDVQELLDNYYSNQPLIPNLPIVPNVTPNMPITTTPNVPIMTGDFTPVTGLTGMPSGLDTLLADYTVPTVVQDLEPTRPADIVVDR